MCGSEIYISAFENAAYRPLSRRMDRCDRVIQNESKDPFGGNVYYVTMQITFLTRKFRNGERNLHCDVVHITTKWVSSLTLDCNGVFAIKAYAVYHSVHYTVRRALGKNDIATNKNYDAAMSSVAFTTCVPPVLSDIAK